MGQIKTEEKSNEITAIPKLLNILSLKGYIVTIDAMGCQKKIAKKIIDKEADYILAVKENQKSLYADIKTFMQEEKESNFCGFANDFFETIEKNRDRIESRRFYVVDAK